MFLEIGRYLRQQLTPILQWCFDQVTPSVDGHVEGIKQDRLRVSAMMLEIIERDAPVLVQGYDLTVEQGVGQQMFTCVCNGGELIGEAVRSPPL